MHVALVKLIRDWDPSLSSIGGPPARSCHICKLWENEIVVWYINSNLGPPFIVYMVFLFCGVCDDVWSDLAIDFHHSTATSIFSHSKLLKMSQISKCYTSSSLSPTKILICMIDSKFQRKQNILLRFPIFGIKKKI